jgi:hypothetical protein
MSDRFVKFLFAASSILVIICIAGFRDMSVGIDNLFYARWFYDFDTEKGIVENITLNIVDYEPGYVLLNFLIIGMGLGFTVASIIYASIIWILILKSFKKYSEIFYLGIFFFITTGFLFFTFNGIRQAIAISIIFYSLQLCLDRKYMKFSIAILLASLFHFSAILMFSLLLIRKVKKIQTGVWLFFLVATAIIPGRLFYGVVFKIASIFPFYAGYFERIIEDSRGGSIGVLYQIALGFIVLYYYPSTANTTPKVMIFNLSLLGALLFNLFYGSPLLSRFYIYFLFFQNYAFAFVVHGLVRSGKKLEAVTLASTFIIIFFYRISVSESGSTPYLFGIN